MEERIAFNAFESSKQTSEAAFPSLAMPYVCSQHVTGILAHSIVVCVPVHPYTYKPTHSRGSPSTQHDKRSFS